MPFYKFVLKTGHQGTGRFAEMEVGAFASTYTKALESAKKIPMVKHDDATLVIKAEMVEELEYIILTLKNHYAKIVENKMDINPLPNICKIKYIFSFRVFKSKEAKRILEFCNRYEKANDSEKKAIELEYKTWAFELIENYYKQQELNTWEYN